MKLNERVRVKVPTGQDTYRWYEATVVAIYDGSEPYKVAFDSRLIYGGIGEKWCSEEEIEAL